MTDFTGPQGETGPTGLTGPRGEAGRNWHFTRGSLARFVAYLLVVAACIFAVVSVQQESRTRTHDLAKERERVGNLFLGTLGQGAVDGCISSNNATYVDRAQLLDSLSNARITYQQLVIDGTFTQAQADRLLKQGKTQIDTYIKRRDYRDCTAAADRYLNLITDPQYKDQQQTSVAQDALIAQKELDQQEKQDQRRRDKLKMKVK